MGLKVTESRGVGNRHGSVTGRPAPDRRAYDVRVQSANRGRVMRVVLLAAVVAVGFGSTGRAVADDEKVIAELKKTLAGKWTSDKTDVGPVEFTADGKIKESFVPNGDGTWKIAEGTYTIDAKGEVKWKAESGGVSLGGWYKLKAGVLSTARGPHPNVTFKKDEEKKK
jgi:uncharacterized protein (TIGR03066 family)